MKAIFLLAILVTGATLIAGCSMIPQACIDGSGRIITEDRSVPVFQSVTLNIPAVITVTQGVPEGVQVTADDNVIPLIRTTVRNGELSIGYTQPCVRPTSVVQLHVTSADISGLSILGTGDIGNDGVITGGALTTAITGNGNMDLIVEVSSLKSSITGLGTVKLAGKADDLTLSMPGAGTIDASKLSAARVTVEILGSGNARVDVTESLTVKITGSGSVLYSGNPSSIEQSITGSGTIRKVG
jgi:Putative auto-transporter adhesin, head GIN domain